MSKHSPGHHAPTAHPATPAHTPDEDAVRDYAYHLYEQSGCTHGHDVEHWLEASACLKETHRTHNTQQNKHPQQDAGKRLVELARTDVEHAQSLQQHTMTAT
jgi:hypothetical protein